MTTIQTGRPKTLHSVQALRGFAAVLVLFFHIFELQRIFYGNADPAQIDVNAEMELLKGFWTQGYAGVDLFFVISGFIMVYITAHVPSGKASALSFIKARVFRVFPLWWVFCLLLMAYFTVLNGVPVDTSVIKEGYAVYLSKSFLLLPQAQYPILGLGWTLIHEVFFYSVFAVLILVAPVRLRIVGVLLWAGLVVLLANLGFAQVKAVNYLALASSPLTLEFIGGACVAWLIINGKIVASKIFTLLGIICVIVVLVFYTDKSTAMLIWGRVLFYTVSFALLVYGLVGLEISHGLKIPKWIVRIGDWSYSLYLSHILVLGVLIRIWPKLADVMPAPLKPLFTLGTVGVIDNLMYAVVGLIACLMCAYFFYTVFERPLIRFTRRWCN